MNSVCPTRRFHCQHYRSLLNLVGRQAGSTLLCLASAGAWAQAIPVADPAMPAVSSTLAPLERAVESSGTPLVPTVDASAGAGGTSPASAAPPVPVRVDCATVSDQAMAADLRAATAQSRKEDGQQLALLLDASVALWTQASQHCEGRAQERARRNLADSERSRQALTAQLGASPACTNSQKDAGSLQELAQQAVRERRWTDAALLYRKAENMWDVAAERCAGEAQQTALQRRDQTAIDAHNAEFCAPVFERAREQSQQLRRIGPTLATAERQAHSQAAETLWREAQTQCKGPALEVASGNVQTLARERGTPWVATAVPGAPLVTTAPTQPAAGSSAGPSALAGASARGGAAALPAPPAPPARPAAAAAATAPTAAQPPTGEIDLQAGNTHFSGRFTRDGDTLSGNGRVRWANGDVYTGDLIKGRRHGQGELIWASGQRYSGSWVDDTPQGKGQMTFANGNRYEGEVANGLPQGAGRMLYASGDRFEGRFNRGSPDGQGIYHWANGQVYEGPWLNEQPHGKGRLRFANGNVFEGELVRGAPEGAGVMQFASGDRYEGAMAQGLPHGSGSYRWTNGDTYTGQWQQGRKHGKGRMTWANGDHWEGVYDNDAQTADGLLTRKPSS
jgi:hypothetical protein